VELRKHPNHPFTPELEQPYYKFLAKSPLNIVSSAIANSFNLNKEAIKLYVRDGEENDCLVEVQIEIKLQ